MCCNLYYTKSSNYLSETVFVFGHYSYPPSPHQKTKRKTKQHWRCCCQLPGVIRILLRIDLFCVSFDWKENRFVFTTDGIQRRPRRKHLVWCRWRAVIRCPQNITWRIRGTNTAAAPPPTHSLRLKVPFTLSVSDAKLMGIVSWRIFTIETLVLHRRSHWLLANALAIGVLAKPNKQWVLRPFLSEHLSSFSCCLCIFRNFFVLLFP